MAIALVLAVGFVPLVASFASAMLLAMILAASLVPGVKFFHEKLKIPRESAVMAVFGAMVAGATVVAMLIVPTVIDQIFTLAAEIPRYAAQIQKLVVWLQAQGAKLPMLPDFKAIADAASSQATAWAGSSLGIAGRLLGWMVMAAIVLTLAFFLLMEGPALKQGLLALIPPPYRPLLGAQVDPITQKLGAYVQGMALSIAGLAVFQVLLLTALGLPLALALGLLSAILAVVPMVGGVFGVIPAALVGLTVSWQTALWALVLGYLGHLIVANFVMPIVFSRSVKLSPLMVTLALLVGSEAAGMFGALVAVPVAAALQVLVQNLYIGVMEANHAPNERHALRLTQEPAMPKLNAGIDPQA